MSRNLLTRLVATTILSLSAVASVSSVAHAAEGKNADGKNQAVIEQVRAANKARRTATHEANKARRDATHTGNVARREAAKASCKASIAAATDRKSVV